MVARDDEVGVLLERDGSRVLLTSRRVLAGAAAVSGVVDDSAFGCARQLQHVASIDDEVVFLGVARANALVANHGRGALDLVGINRGQQVHRTGKRAALHAYRQQTHARKQRLHVDLGRAGLVGHGALGTHLGEVGIVQRCGEDQSLNGIVVLIVDAHGGRTTGARLHTDGVLKVENHLCGKQSHRHGTSVLLRHVDARVVSRTAHGYRKLVAVGRRYGHRRPQASRASDLLICGLELAFSATLAIACVPEGTMLD